MLEFQITMYSYSLLRDIQGYGYVCTETLHVLRYNVKVFDTSQNPHVKNCKFLTYSGITAKILKILSHILE